MSYNSYDPLAECRAIAEDNGHEFFTVTIQTMTGKIIQAIVSRQALDAASGQFDSHHFMSELVFNYLPAEMQEIEENRYRCRFFPIDDSLTLNEAVVRGERIGVFAPSPLPPVDIIYVVKLLTNHLDKPLHKTFHDEAAAVKHLFYLMCYGNSGITHLNLHHYFDYQDSIPATTAEFPAWLEGIQDLHHLPKDAIQPLTEPRNNEIYHGLLWRIDRYEIPRQDISLGISYQEIISSPFFR